MIVSFLAGMLLWTFMEYALHRGLGHNPALKNLFTQEHLQHHRQVNYFASAYKKALSALLVFALFSVLLLPFTGLTNALCFSTVLILMYLVYEFVHSYLHTHAPLNRYGAFLRKHHFYHHFNNPDANHGVTTPIWDIVFGTFHKAEQKIAVPKRAQLKWMLDEQGALLEQYQHCYQLV